MSDHQNTWLELLQQHGAQLNNGRVEHFGEPQAELQAAGKATQLIPLSHFSLLRASGADTADFLQGQTSNDVRLVDADNHQLGSYNTPKGRMLTDFTLFMRGDDYYLQLPGELREAVQKRLTMFIMRSEVTLECVDDSMSALALCGPQAEALLREKLGGAPEESGKTLTLDEVTLLRRPGEQARFICIAGHERLARLWQDLAPTSQAAGAPVWELLEIRAGIPNIATGTVEAFVPQMVNLQLINGISFKKGCYPGQEVVARMQYLGKLKRRMYRAALDVAEPPAAGTELYSPSSASGQGAGKVVNSAANGKGGCELLVVAEIAAAEAQSLYLESENGPQIQLLELPYGFEQTE